MSPLSLATRDVAVTPFLCHWSGKMRCCDILEAACSHCARRGMSRTDDSRRWLSRGQIRASDSNVDLPTTVLEALVGINFITHGKGKSINWGKQAPHLVGGSPPIASFAQDSLTLPLRSGGFKQVPVLTSLRPSIFWNVLLNTGF